MKLTIIFATGNKDKIREIRRIITDPEVEVISMKEAGVAADPDETGTTFEENALIKAQAVADLVVQTPALIPTEPGRRVAVMSDDSGLEIDALGGQPGIYSARYMGHETSYTLKMNHIMDIMRDVAQQDRTARFTAAVAAVLLPAAQEPGKTFVTRGTMEGSIGYSICGEGGFGYDPFFYLPEFGVTSAQLTEDQKNAVSHRGKAVRAMMKLLQQELEK